MRALLLILITLISQLGVAQNHHVPLERMSAYSWADKNGLTSSNITSLIQAKSGYLWITSYSGIFKFDGHQAELYNTTNLPFLITDGFKKVYQAPDDNTLYFASQGSGVVIYKNGEFAPLSVSKGSIPKSVNCLLVESNQTVYIGSNNQGLIRVHKGVPTKIASEALKHSNIVALERDENGTLWVGTEGNGLFAINTDGVKHYTINDGLQSNVVNALAISGDTVYVGTQSGLSLYQNGSLSKCNFMTNQSVNSILVTSKTLWMGSNNGLGRYDLELLQGEFVSSLEASPLTRVNQLAFDKEGSLWVCTGRDGVVQLRETGISNYTTFDGLSSNKINIITQSPDKKRYYIGCDDGRVFQYRNNKIEPLSLKINNSMAGIRDVLEEDNGQLWVASYQGILRKNGDIEKVYGMEDGLKSTDIRRLFKDSNGVIWAGSRSGGLTKIKNNNIVQVFNKTSGLKSNFILSIEEDSKGNLYVGTHSGGLSVISPSGEITNYPITNNDSGVIIFNIHTIDDNQAWVITNLGVFLFRNGVFTKLQLHTIFSGISFFDWLADSNGSAWLTSNQGVVSIHKNELNKFLSNSNYAVKSRLINNTDGMMEKECTGAVRSLQDHSGRLWIPTIGGVSIIEPNLLTQNNNKPEVYVTQLKADTTLYDSKQVTIDAGHTRYVIKYSAMSFVSPKEMKFRYRLKNFDEVYTEVTNERQVEYTNLPPGDYTFHVMASNNDGVWNETGDTLDFKVAAFYYQTTWFYLLVALAALLLLFVAYKWRISGIEKMNVKLRKVNNELDSFVYSASHDLRSPLTSLLGLISLSKRDKNNLDTYLEKMQSSVKKLDAFIADIIDFSSNERKEVTLSSIDIEGLIQEVFDELDYLNFRNDTQVNIDIDGKIDLISDKRRVSIILRNLISNAYKYKDSAKGGTHFINIHVENHTHYLVIQIEDNGIGIGKNEFRNIFKMFYRATENSSGSGLGLYIVKETVEKLQGTITVDSALNTGTTFSVTLPSLGKQKAKA